MKARHLIFFISVTLASSAATAEAWDTFVVRFFADAQFRQSRTDSRIAFVASRISEREDEPLLCDRLDSKPFLTRLNTSLGEPGVNVRTKQLSPARGVAMVYAMESDAYFEQLTFSQRKNLWMLHRVDQGTANFQKDYVPLKKCAVSPRYWLDFEEKAKVLYDTGPK
ncbi:hypothetical protein [Polaromonas aquatica]|uniref:hypothetical protein n=1 Tax=Polaromonas aquatica TaxID=332657 RepID=UPI003D654427